MRRFRSPVLVLACLGLLVSQLSGLHMHVDAHGYTGAPQYTHTHVHGPGHDRLDGGVADADHKHPGDSHHEGERDVSIVELSAGGTKVVLYFVWLFLGLLIFSKRPARAPFPTGTPSMKTRRERWRPPLRAPPLPFLS